MPVGRRSGAGRVPVSRQAPVGCRKSAGRAPLGTYGINSLEDPKLLLKLKLKLKVLLQECT